MELIEIMKTLQKCKPENQINIIEQQRPYENFRLNPFSKLQNQPKRSLFSPLESMLSYLHFLNRCFVVWVCGFYHSKKAFSLNLNSDPVQDSKVF